MRAMPTSHTDSSARAARRVRAPRSLLLAIASAATLLLGAAPAWANSGIEGVWAFESGQIAIETKAGALVGTVVVETKFKECVHPVGQAIWTELALQPDGSYWGKHQWYFEGCEENPERGRAAFRVLEAPDGSKYLLVCLSYPGASEPQPTIATDGTSEHASYGCIKSTLTAPLPTTSTSTGSTTGTGTTTGAGSSTSTGTGTGTTNKGGEVERLTLPSAKQCVSARLFQIHLAEPRYDPFTTVLVTVKGRKLKTVRHGSYVAATIDLAGFKQGRFTVTIRATTTLGHHLSSSRTYHTCAASANKHKPGKLH
jgi:hypothetical protein